MSTILQDKITQSITFTFEGKTYQLKRLGITTVYKATQVLKEIGPKLATLFNKAKDTKDNQEVSLEFFFAILEALPEKEDIIYNMLDDIIKPTITNTSFTVKDPEQFPLGAFVPFWKALQQHPDLNFFLDQLKRVASEKKLIKSN